MKKKILIVLVLLTTLSLRIMANDPYLQLTDSVLLSIKQSIIKDLSESNIKVHEGSIYWLGESYEVKVVFNKKYSHDISSYGRPYPLSKKGDKFKIFNESIFGNFKNYIYKYEIFPYNNFECLEYYFIAALNNGVSPPSSASYGKYKFKVTPDSLYIIDKHIELLDAKEAILMKYNSIW